MTVLHGLDAQALAVLTDAQSARPAHAWLFAGTRGVGKASLAQRLATRLVAQAGDAADPAALLGDIRVLVREPTDKGVLRRNIIVDQIRDLRRWTMLKAAGNRRVAIIDTIDECEASAANALLKLLEEPPAGTMLILISHAPERLLPTIRSRCRMLRFPPLPDAAVAAALRDAGAGEEAIPDLVRTSGGSVGSARAAHLLDLAPLDAALDRIAETGDRDFAVRLSLIAELTLKTATPRYEAFLKKAPAHIAAAARRDPAGATATAWQEADTLARTAIAGSLQPEAVIFQMAGHVATLADRAGHGQKPSA